MAASAAVRTCVGQFRLARAADAAGVPDEKRARAFRARRGQAITRDAGLIVHDRDGAAGEAIEEGGFADVRPADDGDFAGVFFLGARHDSRVVACYSALRRWRVRRPAAAAGHREHT